MCVLALAWAAHPRWQLVLIGNRDELHARSAAPLARWDDQPHLIAGRDLQAGGTWLGVSDRQKLAVITNLATPEGPQPGMASRGALVTDLLTGEGPNADPSLEPLPEFNPFNLIAANGGRLHFLTNRPEPAIRELDSGVYGLANGSLDEPWPKTERIKAMLRDWLDADSGENGLLLDGLRADDNPEVEPGQARVSPIFIRNPVYGTRCSTFVAVDKSGVGSIVERRYDVRGEPTGETALDFIWPAIPERTS